MDKSIEQIKNEFYTLIGALYEVHRELGAGLNEACYQEGLTLELLELNIPFQKEQSFHPFFHGQKMQTHYRPDFICYDNIIVECKSVELLNTNHRFQLYNYMRLTKAAGGILVNFMPHKAEIERYLYNKIDNLILDYDGKPLIHFNPLYNIEN